MNMFGKSQAVAIAVGILVIGTGPGFSETLDPTGYIGESAGNDRTDKAFHMIEGINGYDSKLDPTGYVTLSRADSSLSHDPTGYMDMIRKQGGIGMSFAMMLGDVKIKGYDVKVDQTGYLTLARQ